MSTFPHSFPVVLFFLYPPPLLWWLYHIFTSSRDVLSYHEAQTAIPKTEEYLALRNLRNNHLKVRKTLNGCHDKNELHFSNQHFNWSPLSYTCTFFSSSFWTLCCHDDVLHVSGEWVCLASTFGCRRPGPSCGSVWRRKYLLVPLENSFQVTYCPSLISSLILTSMCLYLQTIAFLCFGVGGGGGSKGNCK